MSVCPVPTEQAKTDYTTVASYTSNVPDVQDEQCAGGPQTSVIAPGGGQIVTQVCCPTPGPPGPAGDCGRGWNNRGSWVLGETYEIYDPGFDVCTDDVVQHNGGTYIAILDHIASATDEPGVGAQWETYWNLLAAGSSNTVSDWLDGVDYKEGDLVSYDNCIYAAEEDHTSDSSNAPDFYLDGGFYWRLISCTTTETATWFDNIMGVWDWIKDIGDWGLEDWVKAIAGGVGLIWAGTQLLDMFNETPEGDGNAASQYNGDPCYSGTPADTTLPDVLGELCEIAGITTYDTSAMPATAVNFTIGQITSARSILQMLSQVYFFDMVDSGGTLKFIPRDTVTSTKTLTVAEDLGWTTQGNSLPAPYTIKRLQGVDLPRSMSLTYFSEAAAHNEMVQTSMMETFVEGQDTYLKVPVTLTEDEALEVAELTLLNSHLERTTYAFTTNWEHIDLEPGDVITVDELGDLRILRIDESTESGLLNFVCVDAGYATQAYNPSGIPSQPPPTYTDSPVAVGYSAGLIVELPPMNGADADDPHLDLAPHGYGAEGWAGCSIYASTDGTNYSLIGTATQEATWGKVATATPAPTGDYEVWDETTTVQVELKTGTLESVTKEDVYNGSNWCVIGEEVIGFRTATLVSGTTYNLSGLLRGRRGTEYKMSDHVANEAFILLDSSLVRFSYGVEQKNTTFYFKFVTNGSDISKATAYTAQPSTVSIRPWAVDDLAVAYSGSPGDITVSWTGRNQFDGEMQDSQSTINPEHFGGYVLQFIDASGSPEVNVRSITLQTTSYKYTTQQQTTDSNAATIARVAQIDLRTGPGYYVDVNL